MKKTAEFFYKQAKEENEHAMKMVKYLVDTGGTVVIPAVEAPKSTFASAEEAVKLSLEWENEVTRQINQLYDIAVAKKDYAAQNFLDWFVEEQIEEVGLMDNLLKITRRFSEKNLMMLEHFVERED